MSDKQRTREQKHAWIYLFNLGFYILPMVLFPYPVWEIAVMVAAMLVFIGLYYYCYSVPREKMLWSILGMYIIACAVTPLNPGSIALFSYAGFFVGFAYNWRLALAAVTGIILTLAAFHFGPGTSWDLFLPYGIVIVVTVSIFGRVERLRQQHAEEHERDAEEIERLATSVERERIARDLHDILGHTLSSIILKSDLAKAQLSKQRYDEASEQLVELSEIARESLSQVRQSVSGYKHGGLHLELRRLEQRLTDGGFSTRVTGTPPIIDEQRETSLVLAITELVTNIIRHSNGQQCLIHFDETANTYCIKVVDNGRCHDVSVGNGLSGVELRIQELGGSMSISTNKGCEVALFLPKLAEQQP
ncbi:two-component system sensor histidine kinase DesK [Idiomarina loihiensis]|uniref:sensor histidine kinase n=1 Tax=Idiomarina TaxID=135575 RepID=UPI000D7108CE|nr:MULTISPECIES: sensor histidine kinase [Idiomarina]PWW34503.1 two-component system sensor histidine kinase DesK [Idiomarina loihiensis]TDP47633.1 two-component system sensor histidine kinase DesK [Idiomarina loihiensis]TDS23374.1 two-component system sensor histidine kinase DesK [Idiomarina sp. H2]